MVSFRLATVAAALLAAGASAMPYGKNVMPTAAPATTKAYPYAGEKCTAPMERCAGAPGREYVEYLGCCGEYDCVEKPSMGWGKYCMPKAAPKCHVAGQRCAGAEGYDYVAYLGCCGDATCSKDPAMGWGSFCKPGTAYDYSAYPAYPAATAAPATTMAPMMKKYGYYPGATAAPATTMAPMKKYGYYPGATMAPTMAPTKGYGYYGYGKKMAAAGSSAFAAFGSAFGCAFSGTGLTPPLAQSIQNALTDVSEPSVSAIIQVITVEPPTDAPTCTVSAATFPAEDATAILDSLCATANAAGNVLSCRFISIVDGAPVAMRMEDLNAVARQAGAAVDLTYEIVVPTVDAVAISLAISADIPAGQDAPVIGSGPSPSPSSSPSA